MYVPRCEPRWYRVFGFLGMWAFQDIMRNARPSWNVISARGVYLYNCPPFEATRAWCPHCEKNSHGATPGVPSTATCYTMYVLELYVFTRGVCVSGPSGRETHGGPVAPCVRRLVGAPWFADAFAQSCEHPAHERRGLPHLRE